MAETRLGVLEGQTYYLRETGGRQPRRIEARERIEIVVEGPDGRQVLEEAAARDVLIRLGIFPYPLQAGIRVNPLARYVTSLQNAERAAEAGQLREATESFQDASLFAREARIEPDRKRLATLATKIDDIVRALVTRYGHLTTGEMQCLSILMFFSVENDPALLQDLAGPLPHPD